MTSTDNYRKRIGADPEFITDHDLSSFSKACERVYKLMRDGNWYSASQIRAATGGQSEALRRLRELRALDGVDVEKSRANGSRDFLYRLVFTETGQGELF